jgi:hypothetical protein
MPTDRAARDCQCSHGIQNMQPRHDCTPYAAGTGHIAPLRVSTQDHFVVAD